MVIRMKVDGLLFDPRSGMYIMLLKALEGEETLPIWIGKPEADSIALALGRVATPRPLTHDLLKNVIEELKLSVARVVVREIIDNTYYATLYVTDGKSEKPIDSRPSDAVAVALRTNSPIFVDETVIEKRNADELEEWLRNLKPEDFGNIM
ncbi:MAG: bifunctional nuclease family protein [Nitrospirae bacterium]|nr:bifunctional nuclease family protein [Nitrospirota bacterium]MBF0536055.1 bifunctional nuclease family protein [Nitrospirota bacterium]MBF0617943.1 bifunctional nuclease family protein [Nitrospirota bacterium]